MGPSDAGEAFTGTLWLHSVQHGGQRHRPIQENPGTHMQPLTKQRVVPSTTAARHLRNMAEFLR
jgi:hypothetical protein